LYGAIVVNKKIVMQVSHFISHWIALRHAYFLARLR